jgi:transglycosylase-like protein with SLT domain
MRHLILPASLALLIGGTAVAPELSLDKIEKMSEAVPHAVARLAETPVVEKTVAALAEAPADFPDITPAIDASEPVPAVLTPLIAIVKPIVHRTTEEICDSLTDVAQSYDLPAPFFIRLLYQESGFRPGVVSRAGAEGIAQFMPETAARHGLDNPYDPLQAIQASARFLRDLARRFGNVGLAAAAYNAGPKRVQDWLAKKGKLPQETQDYVKNITGRPAELWTVAEKGSPAVKLPRRAPCQESAGLLAWDGPDHIPLPPVRNTGSRGATMLAMRAHAKGKHSTKFAAAETGTAKETVKTPLKDTGKHASEHSVMKIAAAEAAPVNVHRAKEAVKEVKKHAAKEPAKHAVQLTAKKQQHQKPLRLTER